MDRVSAILIFCITALLSFSGYLLYSTVEAGRDTADNVEIISEQAADSEELSFNSDTSITNNSDRELWIRARIIMKDDSDLMIKSDAVEKGEWINRDGWYYSRGSVGAKETTKPVIDRLSGGNDPGTKQRFRMKVEAVDQDWLPERPGSGVEAFELFQDVVTQQQGVEI